MKARASKVVSLMAGASLLAFMVTTGPADALVGLGGLIKPILDGIAKLQKAGQEVMGGQLMNLGDSINLGIDDLGEALGDGQVQQTEVLAVNQERDMNLAVKIKDAEFRREVEVENEKTYKKAASEYYATASACHAITNEIKAKIIADRNKQSTATITSKLDAFASGQTTETAQGSDKILEAHNRRIKKYETADGVLKNAHISSGFFLGDEKYSDATAAQLDQARTEAIAIQMGPVPQPPDEDDNEAKARYVRNAFQYSVASRVLLEASQDNVQEGGNSPMQLLQKRVEAANEDGFLEDLENRPLRELLEESVRQAALGNKIKMETLKYIQRMAVLEATDASEQLAQRRVGLLKDEQMNRTSVLENGSGTEQ